MPITDDTLSAVREALEREEGVDASRIQVEPEGDRVVLRGSVPTGNQIDVAATLAEAHAPAVRTALSVDQGLREDAAASAEPAAEPTDEQAADRPADAAGDDPVRPSRRSTSGGELSSQVSEFRPQPVDDDLTSDEDQALAENLPWDPPDAPHSAPTGSEQRGVSPYEADTEPPTDLDPEAGDEEPSLSDLSAAELAQDARGHDDGGDDDREEGRR